MVTVAKPFGANKQAECDYLFSALRRLEIRGVTENGADADRVQTYGLKSLLNVKAAEILILDDIGAEQFSPWIRDDVLQVILQYRMQENLLTFFTSNLDFKDLEAHFATSRSGDETWQAKRIMERIRYLAKEIHLQGDNRR